LPISVGERLLLTTLTLFVFAFTCFACNVGQSAALRHDTSSHRSPVEGCGGAPVAVFQHNGGSTNPRKLSPAVASNLGAVRKYQVDNIHYCPIYSISPHSPAHLTLMKWPKLKEKRKCLKKKEIPRFGFCLRIQLPSNTVNGPFRVTIDSLLSGIEHHRLVGLKPVVGMIETTF
jgi:hypothetical protein